MSKMAELALEIEELLAEGMSPKFIAVTLNGFGAIILVLNH